MTIPRIYLLTEPSPDVLVTLDYPQYCQRINRFNREIQSYNAESALWLERACTCSEKASELEAIIDLIPSRFIALRQSLSRRHRCLKRREAQTRWLESTRKALQETARLGRWWHWLYDQQYRDAQLILRFLNDPQDRALRNCVKKHHPNFLARWESATQALPPFCPSAIAYRAPSVLPP